MSWQADHVGLKPDATKTLCASAIVVTMLLAGAAASQRPPAAALSVTATVGAGTLHPGAVGLVTARTSEPATTVTGQTAGGVVRFFRTDDPLVWRGLLGLDVRGKAGKIPLTILAEAGTSRATSSLTLNVLPKRLQERRITVDERFAKPPAEELPRIERDAQLLAAVLGEISASRLWRGPFVAPVRGGQTSAFGRVSIVNGERRSPHSGIDLQAATGTPVRSPNAGRVVLSAALYYAGDTIIVDHGLGVFSLLAHLSERRKAVGDIVAAGDVVGLSGVTGRITGPHLHWGVRIGSALVDPLSLLAVTGRLDEKR
jgi:murein DD-endopeptidase MepM/ murein hydrolase activator NlpD